MHGLPGDSSLIPSHSHSRLSSLVSAGSCVVRVYRGWVLLSGVFWCGAFGLPLVVVVLSVGSGAGCSWLVRALLVWTCVLGVLSRWLVDPCGVVVLTVLCGLLPPLLGFCVVVSVLGPVCMVGWAWGPLWGGVPYLPWGSGCGCSTGVAGGGELLVEGCWLVRGCLGAAATGQGATRGCRALRSATGVDGCWVPSGRTCEPRWGVFGVVLVSHIGVWRFWAVREAVARPEVWLLSRYPFLFSGLLSGGVRCGSWVS